MTTASPEEAATAAAAARSVNGTETKSRKSLKRAMKVEDVNFLDASKEGNVSRFINVRKHTSITNRSSGRFKYKQSVYHGHGLGGNKPRFQE